MPCFVVLKIKEAGMDKMWVYGIDDWDAREQIASTLRVNAHDSDAYDCLVEPLFKIPLYKILHSSGEWTQVALPEMLRYVAKDIGCTSH